MNPIAILAVTFSGFFLFPNLAKSSESARHFAFSGDTLAEVTSHTKASSDKGELECRITVELTQTLAPDSWYEDSVCGKVTREKKWTEACVQAFIEQANWTHKSNFAGTSHYEFSGSSVSYFRLIYSPNICHDRYEVDTKDAMFIGRVFKSVPASGAVQNEKLYAVVNNKNQFNKNVPLTRGITIQVVRN